MLYDAYELNAVREELGQDGFCEPDWDIKTQADLDKANEHAGEEGTSSGVTYFWTVYGHKEGVGATAIANFNKLEEAGKLKSHLDKTLSAFVCLQNLIQKRLIKDTCGDHFLEACEAVGLHAAIWRSNHDLNEKL